MNIFDKILGALHLNFLNRNHSPHIKAGGPITAGGDIVVGNKNITTNSTNSYDPEVSFFITGPFQNGGVGLEIYNSGTEDLKNLKIKIGWNQYNESSKTIEKQERLVSSFINEGDDPVMISPFTTLNVLRKGEKKIALGIPSIAIKKS